MNITFLTPNLELHGGNMVLLKYANFLAQNGHRVNIITSDKITLTDINPKINLVQYKSFSIKYVDFFLLQKIYYTKIVQLIEDCDFLIPIYTPLLPPVIRAKKQKKLKAKIVFLFQDFFEMVWAGPWIKRTLSNPMTTKNIDLAICVSHSSQKALRSVSKVKSVVIPNGIDSEFHNLGLKKEDYLFFLGRPQKPKGFPIFKQAYKIVRQEFPNLKAKVVAPTVEDDVIDGIEYIKYKNRQQLADIYSKATIYVNTSLGESFGLPALEAMASNTAVVLSDTVGAKEYAVNMQNCILTEVSNASQTAEAIKKLLNNKKLRDEITQNGLKTAKKYNWDNSLKGLLNTLSNLTN